MKYSAAKIYVFVSSVFLLTLMFGCGESPNFSNVPQIEFISISKDTLQQGFFQQDSLLVRIKFQDGDGDIGDDNLGTMNNVFVIDERVGIQDNSFRIPTIPPEGAGNGVEGIISLVFYSTCCIYDPGPNVPDPCVPFAGQPLDEVQYRIYMLDRAGNKSNEILTDPITLRCN